jgi:hypothetical protein
MTKIGAQQIKTPVPYSAKNSLSSDSFESDIQKNSGNGNIYAAEYLIFLFP